MKFELVDPQVELDVTLSSLVEQTGICHGKVKNPTAKEGSVEFAKIQAWPSQGWHSIKIILPGWTITRQGAN